MLGNNTADAATRVAGGPGAGQARTPPTTPPPWRRRVAIRLLPKNVREAAASVLRARSIRRTANSAWSKRCSAAPNKLQVSLAKSLAATRGGGGSLLDAIRQGKASPRLLQDANVRERLSVAKPANLDQRIAKLTQGLPAADAQIQKLIDQRRRDVRSRPRPRRSAASEIFTKNCAVCHRIGGQGTHDRPATRRHRRPRRRPPLRRHPRPQPQRRRRLPLQHLSSSPTATSSPASPAARKAQTLIVADSTGKEVPIPKSQIKRQVESKLSLMPSNFGEVIPPKDFDDLLSYLLASKQQ